MPITAGSNVMPTISGNSSVNNPFAGFSAPAYTPQAIPQSVLNQLGALSASAPPGAGGAYNAMNTLISTPRQSMTNTVMPYLQKLYGQQAQGVLPYLQQQAQQGVANVESELGQRGLVGSSVEQAGIIGAQAAGQQSINSYIGQMASHLAQNYMQAMGMDIQSNNQMFQNLAQAIGQEIQNNTQYNLGQQQIAAANQASANQLSGAKMGMWGSILSGGLIGAGMAL